MSIGCRPKQIPNNRAAQMVKTMELRTSFSGGVITYRPKVTSYW